jgi:hypothetical protein
LSQSQQAPTLRIVSEDGNRLPTIIITGDDIRNLPPGENRIVRDDEKPAASDGELFWKMTKGIRSSVPLTKVGPGRLALPNANQAGPTKHGQGTLVLTSTNNAVYEFRDLTAADFDRVFVTENVTVNFSKIEFPIRETRPASAMAGWPFKRLLFGSAAAIARTTSTGKVKTYTNPQGKYTCESGKFCQCSGADDCISLASADACASAMNCDGAGNGVNCYCRPK